MTPTCPNCSGTERIRWTQEESRIVTYHVMACEDDRVVLAADSYMDDWESHAIDGTGMFRCDACAHSWFPTRQQVEVEYE